MKTLTVQKVRMLLVIAGAFAGLANSGCSTPAVADVDSDQPSTAWWAYQDCIESLPANATASACDKVGTTSSMPRYSYTGGTSAGTSSGTTGARGPYSKTQASAEQLDNSYRTYLNSLDAATQSELAAKWTALANKR